MFVVVAAVSLSAGPAPAQPAALKSELLRTYSAAEAHQGVAVDEAFIYVVANSEIGRYDKATGRKTGAWSGDPKQFPHLNSCAAIGPELVCASSNYPATPMASTVEVFDRARLAHLRSVPLGRQPGSLTWLTRKDGFWWAGFANYDGRGGEPGRDHTATALVKFDDDWRNLQQWRFPASALVHFAPMSASGGVWGDDGLLYVSGHDAPAVFALRVPKTGDMLEHVATIEAPIEGQAIAFDPKARRTLYGINRDAKTVLAVRLPDVVGAAP